MKESKHRNRKDYEAPKFERHTYNRRNTASQPSLEWVRCHYVPVAVLLLVGLAPLVETPWFPATIRALLLQVLVGSFILLLGFLGLRRSYQPDIRIALQRGAHPFLLALFFWSIVSFCEAPYRLFAVAELLRIMLCFGVYIITAYGLRPSQVTFTLGGIIIFGVGMAIYGLLQFGEAQTSGNQYIFDHTLGLFGDNENLGSFLMILLLLALQPALDRDNSEAVRLGAQAASILLLITLVLTCTRSAWIGGICGLLASGIISARQKLYEQKNRHEDNSRHSWTARWGVWTSAATVAAALLIILLVNVNTGAMVSHRALSLTHTTQLFSFTDRLRKSAAACRMASERPLTGWGLGTWPVVQRKWTHERDTPEEVFARHDVWSRGADQQSLAHNFWAQWAAETGGIGLCLYISAIVAFLLSALRELPLINSTQRRSVLLACIAAVVGSCVDAVGSPAYNFPGVSVLPWLCMGLGVAVCRDSHSHQPALPLAYLKTWGIALLTGSIAAIIVLVIGFALRPDTRGQHGLNIPPIASRVDSAN